MGTMRNLIAIAVLCFIGFATREVTGAETCKYTCRNDRSCTVNYNRSDRFGTKSGTCNCNSQGNCAYSNCPRCNPNCCAFGVGTHTENLGGGGNSGNFNNGGNSNGFPNNNGFSNNNRGNNNGFNNNNGYPNNNNGFNNNNGCNNNGFNNNGGSNNFGGNSGGQCNYNCKNDGSCNVSYRSGRIDGTDASGS